MNQWSSQQTSNYDRDNVLIFCGFHELRAPKNMLKVVNRKYNTRDHVAVRLCMIR
jgi:hypothetical protein